MAPVYREPYQNPVDWLADMQHRAAAKLALERLGTSMIEMADMTDYGREHPLRSVGWRVRLCAMGGSIYPTERDDLDQEALAIAREVVANITGAT